MLGVNRPRALARLDTEFAGIRVKRRADPPRPNAQCRAHVPIRTASPSGKRCLLASPVVVLRRALVPLGIALSIVAGTAVLAAGQPELSEAQIAAAIALGQRGEDLSVRVGSV